MQTNQQKIENLTSEMDIYCNCGNTMLTENTALLSPGSLK